MTSESSESEFSMGRATNKQFSIWRHESKATSNFQYGVEVDTCIAAMLGRFFPSNCKIPFYGGSNDK